MTDLAKLSSIFLPRYVGARSVKDFGAVGNNVTDDTAALQAALDARGLIVVPPGNYIITAPLKFRQNTRLVGTTRGPSCWIKPFYSGSQYPIQIDGVNGDGTWVWDLDIENIYFDFAGWTGTATHAVNIDGCFAATLDRCTFQNTPASKSTIRVSKINHVEMDTCRIYNPSTPSLVGVDVLGDNLKPVNGLVLRNTNIEVTATAVKFSGSSDLISADIVNLYNEESTTVIDWDAGNVASKLHVSGGIVLSKFGVTETVGVKIRRSNCTVDGLTVVGTPLYGVDIDGATSSANCHVIGGNLRGTLAVRDTNNLLTTNTYRTSTSYNPTWTVSAGGPTAVGTGGYIAASYTISGKLCTVNLRLELGTSPTVGTGFWTFSLPVNCAGNTNNQWVGSALAFDSGTNYRVGTVLVGATGSTVTCFFDSDNDAAGGTRPFSWAAGDRLTFTITYPVA